MRAESIMRRRLHSLAAMIIAGVFMGFTAGAQTWTPTSAPTNYWSGVASSADGLKLAASCLYLGPGTSVPGGIYTSTNGGTNWTLTSAPAGYWNGIASSTNGTRLAAIVSGGGLYTSTNSGATWQPASAPFSGVAIACSADGTRLLVAGLSTNSHRAIFTSPDFGATWVSNSVPVNEAWFAVASSYSGSNLVVAANSDTSGNNPGVIYTSANAGGTWRSNNVPGIYWNGVASSGDGSRLVAVAGGSVLYTSADGGNTWVSVPGLSGYFTGAAVSGDGSRALAVASSGFIYSSFDGGVTWATNNAPALGWQEVAASLDGSRAVSCIPGGGIDTMQSASALTLAAAGANVLLTWPWPSAGFSLQRSTNLAVVNWATVTNIPGITNWQNRVTLARSNPAAFYRLKSP
jgi:photosystem II stability/assembly factor-like uncharacterized protein